MLSENMTMAKFMKTGFSNNKIIINKKLIKRVPKTEINATRFIIETYKHMVF